MRYTNMVGKRAMEMKVALTYACINMKKLAKIIWKYKGNGAKKGSFLLKILNFKKMIKK